jgi:hypothetical protein
MSNNYIRAALLSVAFISVPALAIEPKNLVCIVVPPHPSGCTFGPAGAGFPEGTMALTCAQVPTQDEEVGK